MHPGMNENDSMRSHTPTKIKGVECPAPKRVRKKNKGESGLAVEFQLWRQFELDFFIFVHLDRLQKNEIISIFFGGISRISWRTKVKTILTD